MTQEDIEKLKGIRDEMIEERSVKATYVQSPHQNDAIDNLIRLHLGIVAVDAVLKDAKP